MWFDVLVKLLAPNPTSLVDLPALDGSQREVVDLVLGALPAVTVFGAPGSGKTTLVVHCVQQLVRSGVPASRIAILSATRKGAGALRNAVAVSLQGPLGGAIVRTPAALAFSILTAAAIDRAEPVPRLITGPEQDNLLAQLLEGYTLGTLPAPSWPPSIPPETLMLKGFRAELRDLLMRAAENGLAPADLTELGVTHDFPEWIAGAQILADYQALNSFATQAQDAGTRYDPAGIIDEAAYELSLWDGPHRPQWDVIIVDDYHEATAATARLLTVARRHGARLVLLGDPDVAVQGFRGARPSLLAQSTAGNIHELSMTQERLGQFGARSHVLSTVWRGGATPAGAHLRAAVRSMTRLVNPLGSVRHRNAQHVWCEPNDDELPRSDDHGDSNSSKPGSNAVNCVVLNSVSLETAFIARELRSAHLRDNIAWTDMAVIARSGAELTRLRRALTVAGVPVAVVGTDIPLREEPAVWPLLLAARACQSTPGIEETLQLLASTIGGADTIAIRKIRRALRKEELSSGGSRSSDELLVEAVADPALCASLPAVAQPLVRVARVLAAGRAALQVAGATAQTVLWELWDATGMAPTWQRLALAGGPGAARADRDLDAVLALFRSAETFLDKMPDATLDAYLDFIESQDIPADSLAPQVASGGKVSLLTPPGAAGQEWPLVVVASVQEGTWPDLRIRDSLMGAARLVEVLSGRETDVSNSASDARKEVFFDELRAFVLAVSRAQGRLIVTAVHDGDNAPSVFLEALENATASQAPQSDRAGDETTEFETSPDVREPSPVEEPGVSARQDIPLDLRGLTALVRAELIGALEENDPEQASLRAQLLKVLAASGQSTADPAHWYGVADVSTSDQLFENRELIPLSPSRVETAQRCALRWSLETAGGRPASALHQNVGVLIHKIASDHPTGSFSQLLGALDEAWPQLNLPSGWPADRQYQLARHMVENLAKYYKLAAERGAQDVQVEVPFSLEVEGALLSGIVDRLEVQADGSARIVDLKTGKTMPTVKDAQTNPQLGIYQLAAMSGAFEAVESPNGASLVFVASDNKSVATREQSPLEDFENNWAREVVKDTVTTMRSNVFTATPNSLCPTCPVRRSCPLTPEGQHVVPMNASETITASHSND